MNKFGYNFVKEMLFLAQTRVDSNDINKRHYKKIAKNCKRVLNDLITLETLESHLEISSNKNEITLKDITDLDKTISIKITKSEFSKTLEETLDTWR